jgi:endonuclease/exonuclease/phosphatase family metal-dependent hydrolase
LLVLSHTHRKHNKPETALAPMTPTQWKVAVLQTLDASKLLRVMSVHLGLREGDGTPALL